MLSELLGTGNRAGEQAEGQASVGMQELQGALTPGNVRNGRGLGKRAE